MSSASLVSFNSARMKARDTARKSNVSEMVKALKLYYNDNGYCPGLNGNTIDYSSSAWDDSGCPIWTDSSSINRPAG